MINNNKNLVSIIMPTYNSADFIQLAIFSIISQTYTNWELIILDDNSIDNTESRVARFLLDKRIIYKKLDQNVGTAECRNIAINKANGKYIAFLDSDDIWEKDKLEKQIMFMLNHNYFFSYTKYKEIDIDGRENGIVVGGPKKISKTMMFDYCWPGCLTIMYDREKIGLIQIENIRKNNDYAMWLKIIKKADCYLLDEVLAKYRRGRKGSVSTHSALTMIKWHYLMFRICEKQSILLSLINTLRNMFFGIIKKVFYVKREKTN